jgi:hypothetical protein
MTDPLFEDTSIGVLEVEQYSLEDTLESLEATMKNLGIDRRSSMPDDGAEADLRKAYNHMNDAKDAMKTEVRERRRSDGD